MSKSTKKSAVIAAAIISAILSLTACGGKNQSKSKEAAPQKIVCLSPSGAEILYAVGAGDSIVARTDFCDFPAAVMEKESVGGFSGETISLETVLSYSPDFVYGSKGMHDQLAETLEAAGIKCYLSEAASIQAVYDEITYIADLTGHKNEGKKVVDSMKSRIEGAKKAEGSKVYYEVWYAPYMSAGSTSFITGIIEATGAQNIFSDIDQDYPMVSEETIIARDPDVIIVPEMGYTADDVCSRAGWDTISAVKSGKVFIVDANIYSRPGPRVADAVESLAEILEK